MLLDETFRVEPRGSRPWWYRAVALLALVGAAASLLTLRPGPLAAEPKETVGPAAANPESKGSQPGDGAGMATDGRSASPVKTGAQAAPLPLVSGATAQPFSAKELAVDLGGRVKMDLVLIPAGSFMMGSPDSSRGAAYDEKPQHPVRITRPFYAGKYPVTQEQWKAVMGSNPSRFKGPKNPVEKVSWDDCRKFLEKLNAKSGMPWGKFVLPTEAQWEYACRAGSTTRYCFGDEDPTLNEYAWYTKTTFGNGTHPVGQKKPNAWGLYDVHGNVWEWCSDWYDGRYYAGSPTDDPAGPAMGSCRVNRGGSWLDYQWECRSARRGDSVPDLSYDAVGLRVCLVAAPVGVRLTGRAESDGRRFQFEIVMEGFDRYYRKEWAGEQGNRKAYRTGYSQVALVLDDYAGAMGWSWGPYGGRSGGHGNQFDGKRAAEVARRLWTGDQFTGVPRGNLRAEVQRGRWLEEFRDSISLDHFPLPCVILWTDISSSSPQKTTTYTVEKIEFRYQRDLKFFEEEAARLPGFQKRDGHAPGGAATQEKGGLDEAIAHYREAVRLKPADAESRKNLGDALMARGRIDAEKGQWDKVVVDLTDAIGLNPNRAEAYYCRGAAFDKKGEKAKAEEDFARAAKLGFKGK